MNEETLCESGWTGDRCQLPLFHDGPHDNEDYEETFHYCKACGDVLPDHRPGCGLRDYDLDRGTGPDAYPTVLRDANGRPTDVG